MRFDLYFALHLLFSLFLDFLYAFAGKSANPITKFVVS